MNHKKASINNNYIEWLVAIAVAYATSFIILESYFQEFMPIFRTISGIMRSVVILLLLHCQIEHYGLNLRKKSFFYFFILYCLYIFYYIVFLPLVKIEFVAGVPGSQTGSIMPFLYRSLQVIGYLLCAETILKNMKPLKYVIISFFCAVIPSFLFIQYVGVEALQILEKDDLGFSRLALGYCNVYSLVISVIFLKNIYNRDVLTFLFTILNIVLVIYILIMGGERGPIFWGIANLFICFFLLSKNKIRYVLLMSIFGFLLYFNVDTVVKGLDSIAPRAAEKIRKTVIEGDTNGRFDVENEDGSLYIIGLKQFLTSPIYGSYFRLVGSGQRYMGAYPHNIFIEVLMTMGLLGFIPFMSFLYNGYKKVNKVMKRRQYTESQLCCLIFFLLTFLQFQTTWSIVASASFWLFFYLMCIFDCKIEERVETNHNIAKH